MKTNLGGNSTYTAFPADTDSSLGLSKREYAAIKLRVPNSGEVWIDAMILKSLRNEFAIKAIQGAMQDTDINYIDLASMFKLADEMIAESAK